MPLTSSLRKVYKQVFPRLPLPLRLAAGWVDYARTRNITTYHDPLQHPGSGLQRGTATFSLDYELSWAWQYAHRRDLDAVALGLRERAQMPVILDLFVRHRLTATWATVGHLFLSQCTRDVHGCAHPEIPQIPAFTTENWAFPGGDWFRNDPCTSVHRDPAWYAPDQIELLLGAATAQEIACHGFSHVGFGPYCPPEVVRAEIRACAEAMRPYGLAPTTLVFPGNSEGNFDGLKQSGVSILRSFPDPSVGVTLPIRRDDGLWAVHSSSALSRGAGWTIAQRLERLKRYVDRAVETNLAAHFWMHPSMDPVDLHEILAPLLSYCADLRDRGQLQVLSMRELVGAVSATQVPGTVAR